MKKEYIKPRMEAEEMDMQGMIATSDPTYGGSGSGNADAPAMPDLEEETLDFSDIKLF